MGGKTSRTKGHSWEREVARLLCSLGIQARRGLEYQGDLGDVVVLNFSELMVQCKNSKQPSLWGALRQAKEDSGDSPHILLPLKRSGHGVKMQDKNTVFVLSKPLFIMLLKFALKGGFLKGDESEWTKQNECKDG